jgi:hypothetical protein
MTQDYPHIPGVGPLPPVIYIAGPFRGPHARIIEANVRRAEDLSWEVWALGAAAICPHTMTRFWQDSLPDDVWLVGDLAILAKCDGVLLTPDWSRSAGARAEFKFAEERGIPIFYTLGELNGWLREREEKNAA